MTLKKDKPDDMMKAHMLTMMVSKVKFQYYRDLTNAL